MAELAGALDFPGHFGNNWDALNDSLMDLDWPQGELLVLAFEDADQLLAESMQERPTLLEILSEVCGELEDFKVLFAGAGIAPSLEANGMAYDTA
jgi:hypothetical protein